MAAVLTIAWIAGIARHISVRPKRGHDQLFPARLLHRLDDPAVIRRVESIRADLCFLGMCSLHPEVGITVGDREEAYVKQAMIGASTEVVGLISLGKMGTSLPYLVGPASRLTRLITDASDEDVLNPYRSQGIEVTST